jgi:tetratricopeptide (TPR) repeat protein
LDERHFGRAEAMLLRAAPCLSRDQACPQGTPSELLVTYADILQHRHDFIGAGSVLATVLNDDRTQPQARAMRAMIRLAQGRAREATSDCATLMGQVDAVVATACLAQAISLQGRLGEAIALLKQTIKTRGADAEQNAWAYAVLAELAERAGTQATAIAAMEAALSGDTNHGALRIQAADLMLRANRPARVLEILRELPVSEPVLLRRAIAAKRLGAVDAEQLAHEWQRAREQSDRLDLPKHERDLALGELELMGRSDRALQHALNNWQTTREIDDARVLVAAARASGRLEAARPALTWIDQARIEDAVLMRLR